MTTTRLTGASPRRWAARGMAVGVIALVGAGCGSSPGPTAANNGVAQLGARTATTTGSTSSTSATSAPSSAPGGQAGLQAIKFSACMRANGAPNFPDPQISVSGSSTKIAIGVKPGEFPNTKAFNSAQSHCNHLLPQGGPSAKQLSPQLQADYLKVAACVRAHGIPNFPDPTFSDGGAHIPNAQAFANLPQFKSAVQACQSLVPGGVGG